jgi:hypothetical protein
MEDQVSGAPQNQPTKQQKQHKVHVACLLP